MQALEAILPGRPVQAGRETHKVTDPEQSLAANREFEELLADGASLAFRMAMESCEIVQTRKKSRKRHCCEPTGISAACANALLFGDGFAASLGGWLSIGSAVPGGAKSANSLCPNGILSAASNRSRRLRNLNRISRARWTSCRKFCGRRFCSRRSKVTARAKFRNYWNCRKAR